jgi:hypothetical protein
VLARKASVIPVARSLADAGPWSSGYDASLTRKRSVVQIRPAPLCPILLVRLSPGDDGALGF